MKKSLVTAVCFIPFSLLAEGENSPNSKPFKTQSHQFSELENRIEQISINADNNLKQALNQLNDLTNNEPVENLDDLAYVFGYRCFLELATEQQTQFEQTLSTLNELKLTTASHPSILTTINFCNGWQSYFTRDTQGYDLHIEKAYNTSAKSGSATLRYWVSLTFAGIAQDSGRHSSAIEASQIALSIASSNLDGYREATTRSILAISENELGFHEDALKNNQLAIDWYQDKGNQYALLNLYQNRGFFYLTLKQYENAKTIYDKTLTLAESLDAKESIYSVYTNLAAIAFTEKKLTLSNDFAFKTLEYAEQQGNKQLKAHADGILAVNYAHQGKSVLAQKHFELSNTYFEQYNILDPLADNYRSWAEAMEIKGRYKEALEWQIKYKALSDKIFSSERERTMLRVRALFESQQKDKAIETLQLENQQKNTELKNKALEQRIWVLSATLSILALTILVILYRQLRTSNTQLKKRNFALNQERFYDPLTRALNRRFFEVQQRELLISDKCDFSLFMLDIDHFKAINDNYGHPCGDAILKMFCQRLTTSVREQDNLIRMGGEEFLLVVQSNSTLTDKKLAIKLMKLIGQDTFNTEWGKIPVTMSVGIASQINVIDDAMLENAIELADKALYKAKEAGRNQAGLIDLQGINLNAANYNSELVNIRMIKP